MTKACVKTSGTSTTNGASGLFFGFHWSFTILEPSGKGWPSPGTPALYASIMVGLATITLSTSSVRAEETTAQSSYPLKSENAIPLGDFSAYLSCAETAVSPQTASTTATVTVSQDGTLGTIIPPPPQHLHADRHYPDSLGCHPKSCPSDDPPSTCGHVRRPILRRARHAA